MRIRPDTPGAYRRDARDQMAIGRRRRRRYRPRTNVTCENASISSPLARVSKVISTAVDAYDTAVGSSTSAAMTSDISALPCRVEDGTPSRAPALRETGRSAMRTKQPALELDMCSVPSRTAGERSARANRCPHADDAAFATFRIQRGVGADGGGHLWLASRRQARSASADRFAGPKTSGAARESRPLLDQPSRPERRTLLE